MPAAASFSLDALAGAWLTGPIFDKELRVASRRKRYYVLRSLYVGLMAVLVITAWLSATSSLGFSGSVFSTSRMAEVGRAVIISVVWFQFFASQLAAILFFSGAISEEMNRGTLNVLMTTPITSLQIVIGKLLSKLVQLLLILSLSLSTLSIVYVFGGVHWQFILSSFFITLTAVLLTGTLTLFWSGVFRKPYTVIFIMVGIMSLWYGLGMSLSSIFSLSTGRGVWLLRANPLAALLAVTVPRPGGVPFNWPSHCALMLLISAVLDALTVMRLRKSMLTFAFETRREKKGIWKTISRLFQVTGSGYPIYFKGLPNVTARFSAREVLLLILLLCGYAAHYCAAIPATRGARPVYVLAYMWSMMVWLMVFMRTMVCSTTAITKEKEARSLSALLCCPLDSSRIIKGKAMHVFRANRVGWFALAINAAALPIVYTLFSSSLHFPGGVLFNTFFFFLSVAGTVVFIIGLGLYLSARLKSSTAAVIAGLAGYLVWHFVILNLFMIFPSLLFSFFGYGFYMFTRVFGVLFELTAGTFFLWRAGGLLRKYAFR